MIALSPPFRLARESDAPALAELVNFAGEGMPAYLWHGMAEPGQDPWELGRQRQAAKARDGQIVVADFGEGAVAGLTGYAIGSEPETIGPDFPALFRPLQELENQALDSWYVNVLASMPSHRGQGLGARLLSLGEEIARDAGISQMSIIVTDTNAGARRLYERSGYHEVTAAPCVREDWETEIQNWVLLMKPL